MSFMNLNLYTDECKAYQQVNTRRLEVRTTVDCSIKFYYAV
jgi:hypothetical protein